MQKMENTDTGYEKAIEIAKGTFWVGFYDAQAGLHCNPYLVVDNDEALVIDGGSRPDFATVMLKILQTGIVPRQIKALVYQHYDPDLCGSIPNFEDTIRRSDLEILTASENLMFIRHYAASSRLTPLSKLDFQYTFSSGRILHFVKTPYSHSAGSFVTFDSETKVLFSSDLFGSYGIDWELYLNLAPECTVCSDMTRCVRDLPDCPVKGILHFHRKIMTSTRALRYSLSQIADLPFEIIAPQHGSIITGKQTIATVFEFLWSLENVGIDEILEEDETFEKSDFRKPLDTR